MLLGFHLQAFKKHYLSYARKSEREKLDHVAYLYELSKTEQEDRYNRRTERLLREAKLPTGKRLENFDMSHVPGLYQVESANLRPATVLTSARTFLFSAIQAQESRTCSSFTCSRMVLERAS